MSGNLSLPFSAPVGVCYARVMNGRQAVNPANPFVPGRGHLPPYLAGREAEQGRLLDLFAYLRIGRRAPRDAVLSGPRGNGKTTLLHWFRRETKASGEDIDVVWLTPGEVPDLDGLATSLVPPSRFASLRPDTLSLAAGIGRLGWELGGRSQSLTLLLTARCARRPLVLILDEAHTLESEVGRALLNAVIAAALAEEGSTTEVLDCRDRLAMLGYVWKPPDAEALWQPGIPSLMAYIADHGR